MWFVVPFSTNFSFYVRLADRCRTTQTRDRQGQKTDRARYDKQKSHHKHMKPSSTSSGSINILLSPESSEIVPVASKTHKGEKKKRMEAEIPFL